MNYKKILPTFLINFVKKNYFFWKYRHIIDKNIWVNYLNDFSSKRRDIYSKIIEENKLISVFEFGCASGPNLKNILLKKPNIFILGFDINEEAISLAKEKLLSNKVILTSKLNEDIVLNSLRKFRINCFDMAIYDRVLYLLSEEEVRSHFNIMKKFLNLILIDDFHSENIEISNSNYKTKNFIEILESCGFCIEKIEASKHKNIDNFFKKNSKILIFKNKKN